MIACARSGYPLYALLAVSLILLLLAISSQPQRDRNPDLTMCMNNQRQLAIAIMMNAEDHKETLPLPDSWVFATGLSSDPLAFNCPTNKHKGRPKEPDYGMNAFLFDIDPKTGNKVGLPLKNITDPTSIELTMDIKCKTGMTSQTVNGLPTNPFPGSYTVNGFFGAGCNADWRHTKNIAVSYLDGHVALIRSENLSSAGRTQYNIPVGNKRRLSGNGGQ